MTAPRIAVAGAGAWGTALAASFAANGQTVPLWGRDADTIARIAAGHGNPRYLPGLSLPGSLRATSVLADALAGATHLVLAVPAQELRAFLAMAARHVPSGAVLVCAAKGIERETGASMTRVMQETFPHHAAFILSGPSFAMDVAAGLPTAVTVAGQTTGEALAVCRVLSTPTLRCYASDDATGVELGGALKNVLAIAAGIVEGRGLGASARAAVITRGFAEMTRLAVALGARSETLAGLSGLGDLVLTASSGQSRNFTYGKALGAGSSRDGLKLAEGVATAGIAARIAAEHGIDTPLIDAVAQILDGRLDVDGAIATLLARPLKAENGRETR